MADIENQEIFNKIFSLFLGIIVVIIIYMMMNHNRLIIIENIN